MRVKAHPILGQEESKGQVWIEVDGRKIAAREGEPIAAALLAAGIKTWRETERRGQPRGLFCALGRCTDCIMTVDGVPNVRTCVTPVTEGMVITSQRGERRWKDGK